MWLVFLVLLQGDRQLMPATVLQMRGARTQAATLFSFLITILSFLVSCLLLMAYIQYVPTVPYST